MRTDLSVRSVELFVVRTVVKLSVYLVEILSVHTTDILTETEHIFYFF